MAFTLSEYKIGRDDPRKSAIVDVFIGPEGAPVLERLPFLPVAGSAVKITRTKTLPTTGFRAIGAEYASSEGEIEEITESLKISGGKITVDRAILKMEGPQRLALSQMMQIQSLARKWNETFYNGDGTGNSFTGLKTRIAAGQIIGQAAAGALSLGVLDEALAEVSGSGQVIMCNTEMYARFMQARRNSTISGNIIFNPSQFGGGGELLYNGVPIIKAGRKADDTQVLGFDEVGTTTSMFVLALDIANGVAGVQNDEISYYNPKGESVASEYDIEWLTNFVVQSPRSALRINNVTNAAIVA